MIDARQARDILELICIQEGIAPPHLDQGLTAWLDEALDAPLAPRGGEAWQRGQALLIEAFQAAVEGGGEGIARTLLRDVVEIIRAESRRACACSPRGATIDDEFARARCVKCRGRSD